MHVKLISHCTGRAFIEGVWEQGVEENIEAYGKGSNRGVEKFRDEEPRKLYSTPNTVTAFKSGRMGWTDYVVRKAEARNA
jgi:uncharacterized protein YjdB